MLNMRWVGVTNSIPDESNGYWYQFGNVKIVEKAGENRPRHRRLTEKDSRK
jgi:hypothetical protein